MLLYFALLALTQFVAAIIFDGPAPTPLDKSHDNLFDGWTPAPTQAPVHFKDLLRRQSSGNLLIAPDNVCGYISGSSELAYSYVDTTCQCAFSTVDDSSQYGAISCCNSGSCLPSPTTCIDYSEYWFSSACDSSCAQDPAVLVCSFAEAPYCAGIEFDNPNVRGLFCDVSSVTTWRTAYTTYVGEAEVAWSVSATGQTTVPSPTSASTSGSGVSGSSTSSSSAMGVSPSQGSSNGGGGGSSHVPLGAIIGAAVGGAIVIALIVLGLCFYMKRSKKKRAESAAALSGSAGPGYTPEVSQTLPYQSSPSQPGIAYGQAPIFSSGPKPQPIISSNLTPMPEKDTYNISTVQEHKPASGLTPMPEKNNYSISAGQDPKTSGMTPMPPRNGYSGNLARERQSPGITPMPERAVYSGNHEQTLSSSGMAPMPERTTYSGSHTAEQRSPNSPTISSTSSPHSPIPTHPNPQASSRYSDNISELSSERFTTQSSAPVPAQHTIYEMNGNNS